MNRIKFDISTIFNEYQKKDDLIALFKNDPKALNKLIEFSLDHSNNKAWRASLLLGHLMTKNDKQVIPYIDKIIKILPQITHDGHQRQLLIILDKLTLNEDQNGHLFNHCLTIWEDVNKIPSTRIRSFRAMFKMTKNHPELKDELRLFTTDYFTRTLSPGIKVSFQKIINKIGVTENQ